MGDFGPPPRSSPCAASRRLHRRWSTIRSALSTTLVALAALAVLVWAGPAAAESPVALSEELTTDGVYVSRVRTEIDETALETAVEEVRSDGLYLVVVAPIDPQPDGESFARRIHEAVEAEATLIFMPDGSVESYVVDDLAPARIRATEKAAAIADPARAALAFADELTSERTPGRPELVGQLVMALVLFSITIGLIVAVEQAVAAARRGRHEQRPKAGIGSRHRL